MKFDDIIGNNKIKELLNYSILNDNILHSYMFIGPDGIGKSLFAKDFAKMILCSCEDLSSKGCNHCKSCIEFDSTNHPDFMVIDTEDGKNIKIEQIRFLQEKIAEKPIISNKKVYIINNSDLMRTEAQNCLLKTLEEPPEYAVIILLLSNESKLLTTIKSRCTKIVFNKLNDDEIKSYLSSTKKDSNINSNILKVCNGSIGKALKLQSDNEVYQKIDSVMSSFETKNIIDIWNESEVLYKSKDNIYDLLDYINVILNNYLLESYNIKYGNCIKIVEETKKRLSSNANYDMCIDNLLLKIWEEFNEKHSRY